MSKAIIGSLAILCIGWWFTSYLVLIGWAVYGTTAILKAGAEGGFFD